MSVGGWRGRRISDRGAKQVPILQLGTVLGETTEHTEFTEKLNSVPRRSLQCHSRRVNDFFLMIPRNE